MQARKQSRYRFRPGALEAIMRSRNVNTDAQLALLIGVHDKDLEKRTTETSINDRLREAQDALDEARRVRRAMRKAFTGQFREAILAWARIIANVETRPEERATWDCLEMGAREALFAVSLDLGWTEEEWDAVEVAARQLAQKMIDEAAG